MGNPSQCELWAVSEERQLLALVCAPVGTLLYLCQGEWLLGVWTWDVPPRLMCLYIWWSAHGTVLRSLGPLKGRVLAGRSGSQGGPCSLYSSPYSASPSLCFLVPTTHKHEQAPIATATALLAAFPSPSQDSVHHPKWWARAGPSSFHDSQHFITATRKTTTAEAVWIILSLIYESINQKKVVKHLLPSGHGIWKWGYNGK